LEVTERINKKIFSILFFSLFSAVLGMGAVVPLLPVYAKNLGATGLYIGFVFGAFSLSRTILLPVFGRLSDKYGRKPFIVFGLLIYSLISLCFVFAKTVESIIIIRFVHGFSSAMIMPVVQAYAGDITPKGKEGISMGTFNISIFFGLSAGPILGGIVNSYYGMNAAFLGMSGLVFIGFLLAYFMLPPVSAEKKRGEAKLTKWRKIITDKDVAGLFIFRFVYTSCIGIIWSFMPIFAGDNFAVSSAYIGLLVAIGVFISGLMHIPMGYVADRVSKTKLITIGGLITGLSVLLIERSGSLNDIIIASVLFGVGGGISTPGVMSLSVIKGKQKKAMGTVMALLTMAHSLGMFVGSVGAGIMMDIFNLRYAFFFGTVLMTVGTIAFAILAKDPSGKDEI